MSKKAKKIWFLTQGYGVCGGHEAHVLHFATELREHGYDTSVLVVDRLPEEQHRFMSALRERKIPLVSIGDYLNGQIDFLTLVLYVPWAIRMKLRGEPTSWALLHRYLHERLGPRWLSAQIKSDDPAIIHAHGRLPETYWPCLPLSLSVLHHGTEGRRDDTWDDSEAEAFSAFAERCARNFAPGQGVAENLREAFGITKKIHTIYTICPDSEGAATVAKTMSERTGPKTVFGILCRMTPEKGIDTLLKALLVTKQTMGEVHFRFFGSGQLDETILAFIKDNGLDDVCVSHDFDSPLEALSELDVFVHPSVSDAMPMAIAEALMCGLPCITTRVGGIPELVRHDVEGTLVEPHDADALAAAMCAFANMDLDTRRTFSESARARYEAVCTTTIVGGTLVEHYANVLAEAPKKNP